MKRNILTIFTLLIGFFNIDCSLSPEMFSDEDFQQWLISNPPANQVNEEGTVYENTGYPTVIWLRFKQGPMVQLSPQLYESDSDQYLYVQKIKEYCNSKNSTNSELIFLLAVKKLEDQKFVKFINDANVITIVETPNLTDDQTLKQITCLINDFFKAFRCNFFWRK